MSSEMETVVEQGLSVPQIIFTSTQNKVGPL